jgi:hypothetical protein
MNRENSKRSKFEHKINNQGRFDRRILQRKLSLKRDGPYQIVRIHSNGILKIRKGNYVQRVLICRCVPYIQTP